jgi:dTDP-4-amino-4,6-dideoxygalactose transaminase
VPAAGEGIHHAHYRFYAYVESTMLRTGWTRDRIVEAIAAEGVTCMMGSCSEIQLERAFEGFDRPVLPVTRELGATSIALLVHHTLADVDIDRACEAVAKVMSIASCGITARTENAA